MDKYDIAFRFKPDGKSYGNMLLKQAVLLPLFGPLDSERKWHAAFNKLLSKWREQLADLHEAGLDISKAKVIKARNCPPPHNSGGRRLQPCGLRICPFCYTRKLMLIRERITAASKLYPDAKLITYTLMVDDLDKPSEQIHLDDMHNCWESIGDVLAVQKLVRERIRERVFPEAYGTACMTSLVPHKFKEVSGSLLGYVKSRHQCIGLVPAASIPDTPDRGTLFERNQFTQRTLFGVMGKIFGYPANWLREDPKLMVEFLYAAHGRRLLIRTGALRDVKK